MEFVNGKDDIPYMKWKNKTCLKPPTRKKFRLPLSNGGISHKWGYPNSWMVYNGNKKTPF